jgi:hypothetical protein
MELEQGKAQTYSPQRGDLVYYFFQGHEEYMSQYACYFFSGLSEIYRKREFMPWFQKLKVDFRKERFVLCEVLDVDALFPSKRSIKLMDQYGSDSTSVNQVPQVVQQVKLRIVPLSAPNVRQCLSILEKKQTSFTVDIFPNEMPDFLILQNVFESRLKKYLELTSGQNSIVGRQFKVFTKSGAQTVRVIKDQ